MINPQKRFPIAWFLVTVVSVPGFVLAESMNESTARENLTFRYAEFVQAFRMKNWAHVCTFVTDETQAGFGLGQMGCDGVKAVFSEDERCWEDLLFALRQGCKISEKAETCSAPPQLGRDVAYLGARATFSYNSENDEFTSSAMICGGD